MSWVSLSDAADMQTYGGKAVRLGRAVRAGMPVPPGIALDPSFAEEIAHESPAALAELESAVCDLGPLAVRSSAVGEDSAVASSAGQYSTYLNVRTMPAVAAAIAQVARSGRSQAAIGYRKRLGLEGSPRVAVVVQRQVDSDTAGVLFTRDPMTGARNHVIEASWGLGGSVASGLVVPDRYCLHPSGAVVERKPGTKLVALHLHPDEGVQQRPVTPDLVTRPCLDEEQLCELSRLAADCERLFGDAQDLEWAVAAGVLHLLQVRPMTRIP